MEYHGKFYCDSHFGVISKIINDHEKNSLLISNSNDLINILKSKLHEYDLRNEHSKRRKIIAKYTFIIIPVLIRSLNYECVKFVDCKLYYSFNSFIHTHSSSFIIQLIHSYSFIHIHIHSHSFIFIHLYFI